MKLYNSEKVFEWYKEAFSEKHLGEKAITPDDVRFSMNDIHYNFLNIPSIDTDQILNELIEEYKEKDKYTDEIREFALALSYKITQAIYPMEAADL